MNLLGNRRNYLIVGIMVTANEVKSQELLINTHLNNPPSIIKIFQIFDQNGRRLINPPPSIIKIFKF